MKKMDIINAITNNNGVETETNVFVMSTNDYNNLLFDIDGCKIENVDKKTHTIKIGKCTLTIIEKNKRERKNNNNDGDINVGGGNGVKSKNAHYIIMLKNYDDKKPETITNIGSCAEIKLWLKTLNRKQIEYLRIYDMLNNPCRLSAWIEREPK